MADKTVASLTSSTPTIDDLTISYDNADTSELKKTTWQLVRDLFKTYFDTVYQAVLVSGTNIKTINSTSLLGSGDIVISGGGSVATDAIWDAKGDLAVGTGANTASRLAVGTNGQTLVADSAEATGLKWSTPAGGGDVTKVGTPVNNQVGVWTGDGTIEGDTALTFDTTTDTLTTGIVNSTSLTASELTATDASKNLVSLAVATYPSLTETSYVKGVTSAIQTQINTKAPSASPTFTGTVTLPKTTEINDTTGDHQYVLAVSELSADRTVTLPLLTGSDEFVFKDHAQTLTNKDISSSTNTYRSASDTATGAVELATIAETNTGTDATRALTPDGLAGSNFGIKYVACSLNGTTALTTSEKAYFRIPSAFTGMNLVSVSATVGTGASGSSSSGIPTFTVKNVTDNNQMLSTNLTVDANEYTSATAATPAVINTSFDDVVTDDLIEVACTVAGTGVTYATITIGFQIP